MTDHERNVKEQEILEKGILQFRAFDKYVRDALVNNQIIFGAAKNFNDPFDCNLPIDLELESFEAILKYFKTANKKSLLSEIELKEKAKYYFENKSYLEKKIRGLINDYRRFSCFQIAASIDTHKDILFWANYADKHKGICMKFNGEIIHAENHFEAKVTSLPIEYVDSEKEIPNFNYIKYRSDKSDFGYERARELNGGRGPSEYFIGLKSMKWKYEKEVRFVYESLNNHFLEPYINVKFNPRMLEKVYIGCNADDDEIIKVFTLPKYEHVNVFKLTRSKKEFILREEKLI